MTLKLDFAGEEAREYSQFEGEIYAPPYRSALHESFAWHAAKYFSESVSLRCGVAARAGNAEVTLDFVATCGARVLALCCDDDARYDINAVLKRDAALLNDGAVDAIYHLRSSDLASHWEDCFYLLSQREAAFFSERGAVLLQRLASDEARQNDGAPLLYRAPQEWEAEDDAAHFLEIVALHALPLSELRYAHAG